MEKKLEDFLSKYQLCQENKSSGGNGQSLITDLEIEYQTWFLSEVIQETEEIMAIDPAYPTRRILEIAAEQMVQYLEADAATIRIVESENNLMSSFGAHGVSDYSRLKSVPLNESISGLVVKQKQATAVSNILEHPLFKDKNIVKARGFNSLLAVPLFSPVPLSSSGKNPLGTMQIYYKEKDKQFNKLEIIQAELLARRISFVLAQKKILDLQKLNRRKEAIVNNIFFKLSRREEIKLKDLFIMLIPELDEILDVQGCSLFTVSDDHQYIHLEASYPSDVTYHEANYNYTVSNHPYFQVAITGTEEPVGDKEYERITSSYVLIKDPQQSSLISDRLQGLVKDHQFNSMLLVPLKVGGEVRHLLTFYATRQRQSFSEEEVELFTFFGKEIMKASKIELLDDVLHDIKNPAIALAGFANRALKIMDTADLEKIRPKLTQYLTIMSNEASRMQDLTQTTSGFGREALLNLSDIILQRYRILAEVVEESKMDYVTLDAPEIGENIHVFCPRFGLERILDNLFGNAVKAVPEQGGSVAVRCCIENSVAKLTVENSGEIPSSQLQKVRQAAVKGRGVNIVSKFVLSNHGNMDIEVQDGVTRFVVSLPAAGAVKGAVA